MMKYIFVFVGLWGATFSQFDPCTTIDGLICQCSFDHAKAVCIGAGLKQMPLFEARVNVQLAILHVERNNITDWPDNAYWVQLPSLIYVLAENNPVCVPPVNLPRVIMVTTSACRISKFTFLSI